MVKPFAYMAPRTIEEACSILREHPDGARVLAGGQSLLPLLKLNLAEVSYLVDLKRIPGMSSISVGGDPSTDGMDALLIGALATHAQVAQSEVVGRAVPLLAETAKAVGHPLVRNRGTLGGSLSHSDPSADLCVSALALDARMTIAAHDGQRRWVKADDFFKGPFATAIGKGEVLERVSFPLPGRGSGHSFQKVSMGHGDFPLVVVSVSLVAEGERCANARIALGGVADRAVRTPEAERAVTSAGTITAAVVRQAAAAAEATSRPSADLDASASYKKRMVRVLVRRALTEALERGGLSVGGGDAA